MQALNMDTIKQITINLTTTATNKIIPVKKEKKKRVESHTWGLTDEELSHEYQQGQIKLEGKEDKGDRRYYQRMISHLRAKISSYRQQDLIKKKYDPEQFVSLNDVLTLLQECNLTCCYCSAKVYVLYELVRENRQWTLDRINNDLGHRRGNLVIACLECNLSRRRTNKDAFDFTKKVVFIKTWS